MNDARPDSDFALILAKAAGLFMADRQTDMHFAPQGIPLFPAGNRNRAP
jgi:hypothetical protein